MESNRILALLSGGDHRSIGRADEVVQLVLKDPSLFEDVFAGLMDEDSVVRLRAADAVEKITRTHASLLAPFGRQILERVALIEQKEVRWHVAQLLPRLRLSSADRHAAGSADGLSEGQKQYCADVCFAGFVGFGQAG